jgi:hypothetical protein
MATGLHQKPLATSCEHQWLTDLVALDGIEKCHLITHLLSLLAHPSHFDLENGGSMYLLNVSNASYIHTVQRPKSRISILTMFKTTCELHMHVMWCTVMHNIKVDIYTQL